MFRFVMLFRICYVGLLLVITTIDLLLASYLCSTGVWEPCCCYRILCGASLLSTRYPLQVALSMRVCVSWHHASADFILLLFMHYHICRFGEERFTARATRLTTCFTEHSAPEIFVGCIYGSINATLELCRTVNNFRISTYAKLGLLGSQVEAYDTTHAADSIMMPCMSDMA